ncbi:hypothetical protein SAMN02745866_00120 [Alteromonadaceae bacterium Bs31]|nr:hypothetical protein SAMN02745866_00120 [Alteromonadaceae bacterium Bs31]
MVVAKVPGRIYVRPLSSVLTELVLGKNILEKDG